MYPIIVEKCENPSGEEYGMGGFGPGKFRGGEGTVTVWRFGKIKDTLCNFLGDRGRFKPWGLFGGKPGSAFRSGYVTPEGEKRVERRSRYQQAGSKWWIETSGGGGWGDPFERDPEKVRWDVLNEFISIERALNVYGVKVDPDTIQVDYEEEAGHQERESDE